MSAGGGGGVLTRIREYSLPLIVGVFAALGLANYDYELYHHIVDADLGLLLGGSTWKIFGHAVTPHFLINDIFMVFFFGVAAKEITDAVLPGGALNPMRKAINPLLGTIGGVVGPAGLYLALSYSMVSDPAEQAAVANGWGVPTATDIALAWLVARLIFGPTHSAVSFLLLLAIADDAIGLGIIAVFYPSPEFPPAPMHLVWTLGAMILAFGLRKRGVVSWWPYVFIAGAISWAGLINAHLHPALALVFIVPFMPSGRRQAGLIPEDSHPDVDVAVVHTLDNYEHTTKPTVDWGLFFFALANAGVEFGAIGTPTWIVLASLIVGKTVGITLFSYGGTFLGFPLPEGMDLRSLVVAGLIGGLGLTVALFVCGEAFTDPALLGMAKMGALLSGSVFGIAIVVARLLGIRPQR